MLFLFAMLVWMAIVELPLNAVHSPHWLNDYLTFIIALPLSYYSVRFIYKIFGGAMSSPNTQVKKDKTVAQLENEAFIRGIGVGRREERKTNNKL
ncbi:MAG: hypothetical protein JWO06_3943 [Bacteroidota bacterium]|nr:hypothetical protein [Bacteroidota bacterium]